MATAAPLRAEGCGLVPVASSMRNMDARYYSPAQCVGQLAENSAAKGSQFNATTFEVSIESEFDSFARATGTDSATKIPTQALKALDDGVGFGYEEVEDMMTYGTPESLSAIKKFGQNNHGLKAAAATLSPACCLLFSKSKKPNGIIWHTLLAFGSNFDSEGLYSFRKLSWPEAFTGTSLLQLADEDFFQCGSKEAFQDMFRTEGKPWASLKDLAAAHSYFKHIKGTGVLGIFPFGQQANTLQVKVEDADIKLQGFSLKELLEKYFVARDLGLLPQDYWMGYRGFSMVLIVNRRKKIVIKPRVPKFEVSPPLPVKIGQAEHTVVYGPYRSHEHRLSLFPYAAKAGIDLYNQGHDFFLASNSRVMNPLYQPKTSDNREVRSDYFSKQRSQNQKSGGSLQNILLEDMCGVKLSDVPEHFEELKDLLNDLRVFDCKNPYLKQSEEYQKQMKNLKWLLGLPFEITVKIDTEYLHFNDAKDDLKDDALKRDAFFASVHAAIALDVCQRMQKGFVRLIHDLNQQPPDNQAKISMLFKPGNNLGASTSNRAKSTTAKRGPKKAQLAECAQQTKQVQQSEEAEDVQQASAAAASAKAADKDPAAIDQEPAVAAAEALSGAIPSANESLGVERSLSARTTRLQSRLNQLPPTELPSPGESRAGKRRRTSIPADETILLTSIAEDAAPSRHAKVTRRVTFSKGLLEVAAEPASKQARVSDMCNFKQQWQQAVADELIVDCARTRQLRDLALEQFEQ